jgi:cysteine desulfurase/selenocysteine lyase
MATEKTTLEAANHNPSVATRKFDVDQIRADFPILERKVRNKPLIYLDNGASTLKPNVVIDRISHYYRNESSNVHRGAHFLAEQGTVLFEQARETCRRFINAALHEEIIFTRGTTESINLVAQAWGESNLGAGDEIILSELEHHSNIVPWQIIAGRKRAVIKVIPIDKNGDLDFEAFIKLLTPKTKMVSITATSNVLGTIVPVKKFIDAAHAQGSLIMIDAAQAVSNQKVDVQAWGADFLAFSGHKIFGPYGIGVLYGKMSRLEKMEPYQGGGSMIAEVTWAKTTWATVPHKFEAGTPSIADALGLDHALRYVEALGFDAIKNHKTKLLKHALLTLPDVPGLKVIGHPQEQTAIVSFTMDGAHPSDIGALVDQQGVAIRAGHHCCQPLMRTLGIPATARASFSIYNTVAEIDVLKNSLIKAKEFF